MILKSHFIGLYLIPYGQPKTGDTMKCPIQPALVSMLLNFISRAILFKRALLVKLGRSHCGAK